MNRFHDCETVDSVLGELAGYASLCWEPKPEGEFQPNTASHAVDEALERIGELEGTEAEKRARRYTRVYADSAGEWRWTLFDRNGERLADSGYRGYNSASNAKRAVRGVFGLAMRIEVV